MNAIELIREVMKQREVSQARLADKIEGWSQSNITGILNNSKGNVRVANLYQILNALGCEIVIRSKTGKDEWVIDYTKEELEEMRPQQAKKKTAEKPKKGKKNVDLDNLLSE